MDKPKKIKASFVFFLLLAVYCTAIATFCQPSVHYFYDAVAIRDMSTYWASLDWKLSLKGGQIGYFGPVAILRHVEGPLQFMLMNLYSYTVGNFLPLNPRTLTFPNILIVMLSAVFAFLIGKTLVGRKFGYLFALSFVLSAWIGAAIRMPWIVFTISCLLELITLYCFLILFTKPEQKVFRILAPLSLVIYLMTALDWPSFLFCLFLFIILSKKGKTFLKNPYNLFPLAVFLGFIAWTVFLYLYSLKGGYYQGHTAYKSTLITYPFSKISGMADFKMMVKYLLMRIGPAFFLALGGVYFFSTSRKSAQKQGTEDKVKRAFSTTMVVWFILFSIVLLKSPNSIQNVYVISIPMAYLAAKFLLIVKLPVIIVSLLLLVGLQLYVAMDTHFVCRDDDKRVLAAATFLIENRPDLLEEGKTAFLPRNLPSNVGQYARGRQERIIMPASFPVMMKTSGVASDENVLLDFVNAYRKEKKINADWLILNSELIMPQKNQYYEFFKRLYEDRQISWIAEFVDKKGRKMWLGEVRPGVITSGKPEIYEVEPLAKKYEKKYDKIWFLKKNLRYIEHY